MKEKIGFILGKFMPLSKGHISLIEFGLKHCDKLIVAVCYLESEPIDGKIRYEWVKEYFRNNDKVTVDWITEDLPSSSQSDRGISKIWADFLKVKYPQIDIIFASEQYAQYVSEYMGIDYKIYDVDRNIVPISATKIRENPFKYWDFIPDNVKPYFVKKVCVFGADSCVDADTEFFNGTEWKKISEYIEGDMVLQFNSDFTASLVEPQKYHKKREDILYRINNKRNTVDQVYSLEHDLVYVTSKGHLRKKSMKDFIEGLDKSKAGFSGNLINSFNFDGNLTIDENLLKLYIAVSADGSKSKQQWRVRLIKERKIERMRELIKNVGLELDERIYEDGSHNFYLPLEYGIKEIPNDWINLTKELKQVLIEEIFLWDGYIGKDNEKSYHSTIRNNADIIQFIFTSMGYTSVIHEDIREGRNTCYRVDLMKRKYADISFCNRNLKYKKDLVQEYKTKDGYKYCFTVDSGMLVLRRNNKIFITGNCGKSTLTLKLGNHYNTAIVPEIARNMINWGKLNIDDLNIGHLEQFAKMQSELVKSMTYFADKLLICDTDNLTTQVYSEVYCGEVTDKIKMYDNIEYDLYIFLDIDTRYRTEGQRNLGDRRQEMFERFQDKLAEKGIPFVFINGTWDERLEKAVMSIDREFFKY